MKRGGSLRNLFDGIGMDYRNDENISCQNIEYFNRDGGRQQLKTLMKWRFCINILNISGAVM